MKLKPSSFYWNIIAGMGWAKATLDPNGRVDTSAMKREFMETYSEKIAAQFNEWYRAKYRELVNAYDAAEKETGKRYGNFGGDDSFGDMMDHIMGLREEYYNTVMADFKLLNNLDPVESFAYCIPYTSDTMNDYDDLKPKTHKKQAKRALKAAVKNAMLDGMTTSDLVTLADTMKRLTLIMAGKFDEAVGDLDFDKDYGTYYGYDGCDNGAQYANTMFDCKKYMTK